MASDYADPATCVRGDLADLGAGTEKGSRRELLLAAIERANEAALLDALAALSKAMAAGEGALRELEAARKQRRKELCAVIAYVDDREDRR